VDTFESDGGVISSKPIVAKRQWAFAKRWAKILIAKGLLRRAVEHQSG
jgi:hypothetical protein